jgi:hypothetical protein
MKVIEGNFGKPTENERKASDMFQLLADYCEAEELKGAEIQAVSVTFVEGESLAVASTVNYPDGAYMLLSMGKDSIMEGILGGTEE